MTPFCESTSERLPDGSWVHSTKCGHVHELPAQHGPPYKRPCDCTGPLCKNKCEDGPPRQLINARPDQCLHRGDEIRRQLCDTCQGEVEVKVFQCNVLEEATIGKPLGRMACCVACHKFTHAAFCINLASRPDRWDQFQKDHAGIFDKPIERAEAVNGNACPPPSWWKQGGGAWGCYRSHLAVIESALNRGLNSIIVLEDDAVPVQNCRQRFAEFIAALPDDWHMAYLGGQLIGKAAVPVNDLVCRAESINRTHAYMVRQPMLGMLYKHLCTTKNWGEHHHVDHHMARLHADANVYIPWTWLWGQGAGHSDITGRDEQRRLWDFSL